MENASKALIIAGAILLSILIIAIGMYIYNSSKESIDSAGGQISAQEISSFNQTWEMYEGKQSGSNVKALISKLSTNAKAYEEESSRLPDLYVEPNTKDKNHVVSDLADDINITGFNKAKSKIESKHQYHVYLIQSKKTSLIMGIAVTYEESDIDTVMGYFDLDNDVVTAGTALQ